MANQIGKLTAVAVSKKKKPGLYRDGGGLSLQIAKGGSKSWIYRFMLNGKARSMGLGSTNTYSLSEAREMALECRKLARAGIDPIKNRGEDRGLAALETAKALIIAAGMGSRLKGYTEDLPKCMLDFGGKTLLERQLDSYRENGINTISLIRGYKSEKINYDGIHYYENPDYEQNNILNSLMYGEEELNGNVIVSYSDILFEPSVVKRLLESDHDISIVIDAAKNSLG